MSKIAEKIRKIRQETPVKRAQFLVGVDRVIIDIIETKMFDHFKDGTHEPYTWQYKPEEFIRVRAGLALEGAPSTPHTGDEYNELIKRIREHFSAPDYLMYTDSNTRKNANGETVYPPLATWRFEIVDVPGAI